MVACIGIHGVVLPQGEEHAALRSLSCKLHLSLSQHGCMVSISLPLTVSDQRDACHVQLGGRGGGLPQWAVSLIIFGSCVLVTTLVLVAGRLVHYLADRNAGAALCPCLSLRYILSPSPHSHSPPRLLIS